MNILFLYVNVMGTDPTVEAHVNFRDTKQKQAVNHKYRQC